MDSSYNSSLESLRIGKNNMENKKFYTTNSNSEEESPANESNESNNSNNDAGYNPDYYSYEETLNIIANKPAKEMHTEDREAIKETEYIKRNPAEAGIDHDKDTESLRGENWAERSQELREELRRRKDDGEISDTASTEYNSDDASPNGGGDSQSEDGSDSDEIDRGTEDHNNPGEDGSGSDRSDRGTEDPNNPGDGSGGGVDSVDGDPSTETKRKVEDEDESNSPAPAKRFKQDSSDVTSETEPMEYGWDSED